MATDMRTTPSGQPTTALTSFDAASAGMTPAGVSHASSRTAMESSIPSNSAMTVFS